MVQKEVDVEKRRNRRWDHEEARLRSKLAARYPYGTRKCRVKQSALRHLAAVACSNYEKLAEIERRMPADRPPKRTRDANADAKEHAESEYDSDVDCVFVRLGQVRAGKQCIRDQRRGSETGSTPE